MKTKRLVGAVMAVALLGCTVVHSNVSVNAQSDTVIKENSTDNGYKAQFSKEAWLNEKGEVKFPVTADDKEWGKYDSYREMVQACTIPDDLLKELSTKELIKLTMNYPILINLYSYDDYDQALYAMENDFNGLKELLSRKDYIDALLSYYKETKLPAKSYMSKQVQALLENETKLESIVDNNNYMSQVSKDVYTVADIELTETIMMRYIKDNPDKILKQKLIFQGMKDKLTEKYTSSIFKGRENIVYKLVDEIKNVISFGKTNIKNFFVSTTALTTTVKTPKGTKVYVVSNGYYGDTWAKAEDAEYKKEFPKATIIRSSDNRYNCHSYAWYNQGTNNRYWMNDPRAYVTDGSYAKITNSKKRGANNRICWELYALKQPIVHSGILKRINSDGSYTVYSKWGKGPLMSHAAKYSPYSGTREYYKLK